MIEVKPTTLKQANAYVEAVHRHHGRVVGHKWSLAAFKDGRIIFDLAERLKDNPGSRLEIGG